MRNLLRIFLKHYAVFLFILLELFAFIMVFQQNYYHNAVFINSSSGVVGFINKQVCFVTDYISLKKENDILLEENLRLHKMLEALLSHQSDYNRQYASANVINNSVVRQKNYITIDKGENQGIKKGMAVVGPQGIIGVVENTSPHFSSVIPIINLNFHLSSELSRNGAFGSLSWNGQNNRIAHLNEIPSYIEVKKGDTVVSSGFSASFPEGELVGVVKSAEKSKASAFWTIKVELATDFRQINKVYIIINPLKEEQIILESSHD